MVPYAPLRRQNQMPAAASSTATTTMVTGLPWFSATSRVSGSLIVGARLSS
ncbi:MAG: hypothetical protein ABFC38_13430 [Methanospirillum sp.]